MLKKISLFLLCGMFGMVATPASAVSVEKPASATSEERVDSVSSAWIDSVAVDVRRSASTIHEDWFLQFGADVTLQNPYGHNFSEVFKKGTSVGVDVAVGKWFTHEIGMRGKVNWENGIVDSKADWLAPFDHPGVNHDKGGYVSVVGDVLLDMHNIFGGYKPDRVWNMQVFPRFGLVYNLGVSKGSPLIGFGIGNTFRLSDRWGIYADVAYNGVSSGFTGVDKSTGVGSGSNMYFDFNVGVTYQLGRKGGVERYGCNKWSDNSLWRNWFLQMGADMTLYLPYGVNLADVMSKGRSWGLDFALGKWFSPEIGMRGSINMENFLFENKSFEWVGCIGEDGVAEYSSNYEGGGNLMIYADALVSVKHLAMGYTPDEKWDCYAFTRMGLAKNKAIDSLSPVVGCGLGTTYRFNKHWSLYFDSSFCGVTSEFFGGVGPTGMLVKSFNSILDFNVGVQLNIGKFGW